MWRTLISLVWCVQVTYAQYTYRLLGGPQSHHIHKQGELEGGRNMALKGYGPYPPPAPPPAHFVSRTARHFDTREDLSAGPYLQKDNFFSSGFLEDLLGFGKPPPPKREIQHQSIFPSFFSAPAPPQRQYRPPPPPQYTQVPQYPIKPSNPISKKFSPLPKAADSPYKYSVKGASTHYVEKPSSGAAVQGYPAPHPHHMHRQGELEGGRNCFLH